MTPDYWIGFVVGWVIGVGSAIIGIYFASRCKV